ncbi:hypothetical protein [Flavobacterium saccharophilum]|uniref:Uncharacterized protein n=1 Tax=Flavobacterium saccharophilum TaxID=29534 RepID=A0A1M7L8I2_9FLAO|nr:hypothetical protein [Flavobacterium saccharophilum]SHM74258.1 hypothetical protein SAMN05444366_3996 [Flavobacterium saccharophilum]
MKKLFRLLYSLLFVSCISENKPLEIETKNPIGIGILEINSHEALPIYLSKTLDEVIDTITFDRVYLGKNSGSLEINSSVLKTKFKPYAISASSGTAKSEGLINSGLASYGTTLKFTVIESNPKYFKVILNETTKEIGYIKPIKSIKKQYDYKSWKSYLQSVQMINLFSKEVLYDKPMGSKTIILDYHCAFKVIDVQNEWAEIKPVDYNVGSEKCKDIQGWIKWRNNDKITIKIILQIID